MRIILRNYNYNIFILCTIHVVYMYMYNNYVMHVVHGQCPAPHPSCSPVHPYRHVLSFVLVIIVLFCFRHHDDHMLYLHEISLDHDLSNNTLQLTISSSLGPLLTSSLTIHELSAHLVILFQSSSTVFRLVLPHPDAILKVLVQL